MSEDHYSALGLPATATLADIKKAFRQKASFYHPDRNAASDAAARFGAVQQAYDVLSDAAGGASSTTAIAAATCSTILWQLPARSGRPT